MSKTSSTLRVSIIGAGPAGLMAATVLARAGYGVTVYDHMPTPGRKLLMAGRGGLNLTHSEPLDRFMARYGERGASLKSAIQAFSPDLLRKWAEDLGQETFIGSSGRVFPKEMKASPLLRAWLKQLDDRGVKFLMRHRWLGWDKTGRLLFKNDKNETTSEKANATLLALGGASWPKLGSDGAWAPLLRDAGIAVAALRPANCSFLTPWSTIFGDRFAGQPLKSIKLTLGTTSIQGEAMVTHSGLEGQAIYALSGNIRAAIDADGKANLSIDLRPSLTHDELTTRLSAPRGSQSASNFLRKHAGLTPVAIGLMRESINGGTLPSEPGELAAFIKNIVITLNATGPIDRAISTAGGIAFDEIDSQFMLKKKPGVFIAGEMLDWEAPTGGYLLQASFSTAVSAAEGIKSYLVF